MRDVLAFGLLSFTSLVTIIDPVAVAPVFAAMTDRLERSARRRAALRACAVALGILLVFAIGGGLIFRAFGITIDALRIAGGILFFAMSMQMLTGGDRSHGDDVDVSGTDPSIVPLGIPLICGPGAISTVMVLVGQNTSAWHLVSFLIALVLAIAATALVLIVSPVILRLIGRTGVEITTRIIGLIVCAIGIQFIIDGVRPVALEILSAVPGAR